MNRNPACSVVLLDHEPATETLSEEVLAGLSATPRSLPCKLFYDEVGSRLFDRICELDEYYPTRCELRIMRESADEIVDCLGRRCRLVELGSGSSLKTRILLDRAHDLAAYVPIDISRDHLLATARELACAYPRLAIRPVCADYTRPLPDLPRGVAHERTLVYFPGSTIGNFSHAEAVAFLARLGRISRPLGGVLIGVDLVKDRDVLRRAYNDREGVTARFNLNALARVNAELGADFDLTAFEHRAVWDERHSRIEMRLVSRRDQTVRVDDRELRFAAGEHIVTEHSHKFTIEGFAALAGAAGFDVARVWTDPDRLFSVQLLEWRG